MERIMEEVEKDRDTGFSMDDIKKIPKGLYDFLCSKPDFACPKVFPNLAKDYNLIEGALLSSKKISAGMAFIGYGQEGERGAKKFLLWPNLPRGNMVINLVITCGDSSFYHEESIYRQEGIYVDFRANMKLINAFHAGIYSAIFSYLENYLKK